MSPDRNRALADITAEVVDCRLCPRLVAWREEVAANPRSSYRGEVYWGRPIAGWGDPAPAVLEAKPAGLADVGHADGRIALA